MKKTNKKTHNCYCFSSRCIGCIYFRTISKGIYITDCVLKRRKKSFRSKRK